MQPLSQITWSRNWFVANCLYSMWSHQNEVRFPWMIVGHCVLQFGFSYCNAFWSHCKSIHIYQSNTKGRGWMACLKILPHLTTQWTRWLIGAVGEKDNQKQCFIPGMPAKWIDRNVRDCLKQLHMYVTYIYSCSSAMTANSLHKTSCKSKGN